MFHRGVIGHEAMFDGAQGLEAGRLAAEFVTFGPTRTFRLHLAVAHAGIKQYGVQVFEIRQRPLGEVFLKGIAAQGVEGGGGEVELVQYDQEFFTRAGVDGGGVIFIFHGLVGDGMGRRRRVE